ncbi:MAG: 1-pyrroline-5-carboxylate dehydrogenase, partial [Proteobacteria bacterium]|nr:1-pyrroline-5-carboxylate dehydrogenase [Pseudomonadota bacterium]
MISANIPQTPAVSNEPINDYRPGSDETTALQQAMDEMAKQHTDIPNIINGLAVKTSDKADVTMPHDHQNVLGTYYKADKDMLNKA